MKKPEAVNVLEECIELQLKKSNDYQNPNSTIRQADYYPHGLQSITDIVKAKYLRVQSVMEAMENDDNYSPNFESLEDSFKDLINYSSFAVSWIRGGIDGQTLDDKFVSVKARVAHKEKPPIGPFEPEHPRY